MFHKRLRTSATVLQRHVRGYRCRQAYPALRDQFRRLQLQTNAATRITNLFRHHLNVHQQARFQAAMTLQAVVTGFLTRRNTKILNLHLTFNFESNLIHYKLLSS